MSAGKQELTAEPVQMEDIERLAHSNAPPPKRLAWVRSALGLTQDQLATAIGVSQEMICHYEAGTHVPSDRMRQRLQKITSIPRQDWGDWAADQRDGPGEAA